MPFPRLASGTSGLLVLGFLPCQVRPPQPGLPTALFTLASRSQRAQQFQKNASHFEKHLISEPLSKPSTGPSIQGLCRKIDSQLSHSNDYVLTDPNRARGA